MDGISTYNTFVALHKPQLVLSNIPEHLWPALNHKLKGQVFDAGSSFTILKIDYEDNEREPHDPLYCVKTIKDLQISDPDNVFLIDHIWTFRPNSIKSNLRNIPRLLDNMCQIMDIEGTDEMQKVEKVHKNIWRFAQTYALNDNTSSVEDRVPVWYVMDTLGSAILHSDTPNFRAVPFIYIPEEVTYTILFPIENVLEDDLVTRNFVEGEFSSKLQREALLLPFQQYDYYDESFEQIEPDQNYFLAGHILETLPNNIELNLTRDKLKVFTEYSYIAQYLTSTNFEIVDNEEEADILWYLNHFKNFKELSESSPHKFINQFPFEYVITIKDLLAITARRCKPKNIVKDSLVTYPLWLPTTFNLQTELSNLVSLYKKRELHGLDNHWICKPYNLARSLDTYITDNLLFLCRLPLTGPKIAQKYIENPVLFERPDLGLVKFDIRYVILLKSVRPTKVYIYKNFFLRFSNKPFSMDNFDDYEKHFTVMNYDANTQLYRMLCDEFKQQWAQQYPDVEWDTIEDKICQMFKELFNAATSTEPPCGIAKSEQSRALYAADIMLAWDQIDGKTEIKPKLLEVNFMPDCQRACVYYPEFYNDIFSLLFLNKNVESCKEL